jgi:hypothetical protein
MRRLQTIPPSSRQRKEYAGVHWPGALTQGRYVDNAVKRESDMQSTPVLSHQIGDRHRPAAVGLVFFLVPVPVLGVG